MPQPRPCDPDPERGNKQCPIMSYYFPDDHAFIKDLCARMNISMSRFISTCVEVQIGVIRQIVAQKNPTSLDAIIAGANSARQFEEMMSEAVSAGGDDLFPVGMEEGAPAK